MRIIATKVKAKELRPGDLFSVAGPDYWDHYDKNSLGQRVYIRTEAPSPPEQAEDEVYRIEITA